MEMVMDEGVTQGSLTFEPKLNPPFTLPVMLLGVWW